MWYSSILTKLIFLKFLNFSKWEWTCESFSFIWALLRGFISGMSAVILSTVILRSRWSFTILFAQALAVSVVCLFPHSISMSARISLIFLNFPLDFLQLVHFFLQYIVRAFERHPQTESSSNKYHPHYTQKRSCSILRDSSDSHFTAWSKFSFVHYLKESTLGNCFKWTNSS